MIGRVEAITSEPHFIVPQRLFTSTTAQLVKDNLPALYLSNYFFTEEKRQLTEFVKIMLTIYKNNFKIPE